MFVVVFGPYGQTRLSKKCILAIRCARSPLVTDLVRRSGRPVAPRPVGAPGRGPASGAAARQAKPSLRRYLAEIGRKHLEGKAHLLTQ